MSRILVCVAKIREDVELCEVYPKERQQQIEKCSNIKVKKEKYFAWRLLEYATERFLCIPFESHNFKKEDSGKWTSDKCYFSISHSQGTVAVAVSDSKVGVDIEAVKRHHDGLETKILTPLEMRQLSDIDSARVDEYVIGKWSEKESIFKTLDQRGFEPTKLETSNYSVCSRVLNIGEERFILSVSADDLDNIEFDINI